MKKFNIAAVKISTVLLYVALTACSVENQAHSSQASVSATQASSSGFARNSETERQLEGFIKSCAACHGAQGVSENDLWPNLAGQNVEYLVLQLTKFRDGERSSSIMPAAMLNGLSDKQLREVARYYSELPYNSGKELAELKELPGAHVRARCVSCHAMSGIPVTSLWPSLGGQKAGYLAQQLRDYKSGKRQHLTMQVIASELNERQIVDVAEYYSKQ